MNNREDLISRKAAMSVLNQETVFCVKNFKDGEARGYAGAREIIANLPAVDAVEVVHGKWKLNNDGSGTCGNCHRTTVAAWDMDSALNYCPHCGSRMDGE